MRRVLIPVVPIIAGAMAVSVFAGDPPCNDVETKIDSLVDGSEANICVCFVSDEVAMTILDVPPGEDAILSKVQIFWESYFGGQPDSIEYAIVVFNLNQTGPVNPATFAPLCSEEQGCILLGPVMQDGGLNQFEFRPSNIALPFNRFGIGLVFLTDQSKGNPFYIPSVVSDDDGHNNKGGIVRNWVFASGLGWYSSQALGVSGDWVIRALVEVCQEPTPPCPWDLDGDGSVGITDFLVLLALWGTDPGGPPDFDGDGQVGITDFLELLANWGPCP